MMVGAIAFMFVQCALLVLGNKWDGYNDPATWNPSFQLKLDQLPTSGQPSRIPWSDTYWPSYVGGIANRWQDEDNGSPGFNYTLYTLQQLKSGNIDLNILSPAEKFDLFNARYDYPLLNSEWQRCSPDDQTWEGICHGWTPASIQYAEPGNVTLTNKDGIKIPFGSSDIKALLSYYLAQYAVNEEVVQFISERCNADLDKNPKMANNPECLDINAGTFHVMLTNMLGIAGTAFVCDVDRGYQVWNQPVTGYECTLGRATAPTNTSAPGTVKQQPVSMTMYYVKETYPQTTAHDPLVLNNKYKYSLDLDANGNILGGSYDKNQFERVDFMWAESGPQFYGYFAQLDTVYKASIGALGADRRRLGSGRPRLTLADYRATTVTDGHISLSSYNAHTRLAWLIPGNADRSMRLHFTSFYTRRHVDTVNVIEVVNGAIGAPIAVLHGSLEPKDIVLPPGVSALVTFKVNEKAARRMALAKGTGFELVVL